MAWDCDRMFLRAFKNWGSVPVDLWPAPPAAGRIVGTVPKEPAKRDAKGFTLAPAAAGGGLEVADAVAVAADWLVLLLDEEDVVAWWPTRKKK